MGIPIFDKSTIPDLAGRVILLTGGTAGVGAGVVIELAKHNPAQILFTGRSAKSAESTISSAHAVAPKTQITFIQCDLASLASVSAASKQILALIDRLDIFMAIAGIMAKPPDLSVDGYEIQWATNHLGHALMTKKLLPLLEKTASLPGADVRVVMTSSTAWAAGSIPEAAALKTEMAGFIGHWTRYCNSKLANLVYANELSKRYPNLKSFSITPGIVKTGLVTELGWADLMFVKASTIGQPHHTPEQGTWNHLWAVSVPREEIVGGTFYERIGVLWHEEQASGFKEKDGERLWDMTEEALKNW